MMIQSGLESSPVSTTKTCLIETLWHGFKSKRKQGDHDDAREITAV